MKFNEILNSIPAGSRIEIFRFKKKDLCTRYMYRKGVYYMMYRYLSTKYPPGGTIS